MAIYQILQRPDKDGLANIDESEIIGEKFSWLGAIFTPLWLMSKNLWLEFVLWLAFIFALSAISSFIGAEATFWLYVIFAIWFGFEAPNILSKALIRRGYILQTNLLAPNYEQAVISWIKYRLG